MTLGSASFNVAYTLYAVLHHPIPIYSVHYFFVLDLTENIHAIELFNAYRTEMQTI